jgi:hypothetical protein
MGVRVWIFPECDRSSSKPRNSFGWIVWFDDQVDQDSRPEDPLCKFIAKSLSRFRLAPLPNQYASDLKNAEKFSSELENGSV